MLQLRKFLCYRSCITSAQPFVKAKAAFEVHKLSVDTKRLVVRFFKAPQKFKDKAISWSTLFRAPPSLVCSGWRSFGVRSWCVRSLMFVW
jgi:hypothetical protein